MGDRVWLRRAYEQPGRNDGARILVDRLWPRGVARSGARLAEWVPDVAPSDDLRRWFGHAPDRWTEFRRRYRDELADNRDVVDALVERARQGRITLVFAAADRRRNNAVVLGEVLEQRLGEGDG